MAESAQSATGEAALVGRWLEGGTRRLRLEDGRALHVIFPGVPGGGAGPDVRDAILDAGGDYLRGDVECHLLASGWRAHGHDADPAYRSVVLHVVERNDAGRPATLHAGGRAIPVLVLPARGSAAFPPPFTPPCALAIAGGLDPVPALERMGARRLRAKAAAIAPLIASDGAGQAFYTLALETLAGPANRGAFAALARSLPLAALLERAGGGRRVTPNRPLAIAAELKGAAAGLALRRAGMRPAAAPGRRLEVAARLIDRLWPEGVMPLLPVFPAERREVLRLLGVEGAGRGTAIELAVNAVLPVLTAAQAIDEAVAEALLGALPAPGTYGKLRSLEGWLAKPFASAATLQGGLLLHGDYCTRGRCGRCPVSAGESL